MAFNIGPKAYTGGKVLMVDPNPQRDQNVQAFQGYEDYNIFVELTTYRKLRSRISRGDDGITVSNRGDTTTTQDIKVNFIDGSDYGGDDRALTTNYTELRTDFEDEQGDLGTLGITNIDIEFNTSFAPQITINFVDVRGRMLEKGTDSKYNIFFDLPYPLFALTVKGYYGPAVTYCLHLTKFKSKFNSDTGNFEITTNFIGYTYALLSDILLGYARAIGETDCGQEKLAQKQLSFTIQNPDDENDRGSNVPITINDFLSRTESINKYIEKMKQDDEQLKQYVLSQNVLDELSSFKEDIRSVRNKVTDLNNTISGTGNKKGLITIIKKEDSNAFAFTEDDEQTSQIKEEYDTIRKGIQNFNEENLDKNNRIDTEIDPEIIKGELLNIKESFEGGDRSYISDFIQDRLIDRNGLALDTNIVLFDTKTLFDRVDSKERELKRTSNDALKQLSKRMVEKIQDENLLGFKPTLANIIEIFSMNVEVLMECIKEVSDNILNSTDERVELLGSLLDQGEKEAKLDFIEASGGDSENNEEGKKNANIYPFPEYREKKSEEGDAFVEKWIGTDLPELREVRFTEELINGLLESKKSDEKRIRQARQGESAWYPIHPLDVKDSNGKLLNKENPYTTNSNSQLDEIVDLINNRAFAFLSLYPNRVELTEDEIRLMAKLEANNVFNSLDNSSVKSALDSLSSDQLNKLNDVEELPENITDYLDSFRQISILTPKEFGELGGNLPTYNSDLMSELNSENFQFIFGSNLDDIFDLPDKNTYFTNTKFIGINGETDFTQINPSAALDNPLGDDERYSVSNLFYQFGISANFVRIPFTNHRRENSYSDFISDQKLSGNKVISSTNVNATNVNPHRPTWQNKLYIDERDIDDGDGLSLSPGNIKQNILFDRISMPFIGITQPVLSPPDIGGNNDSIWANHLFGTHFYYEQNNTPTPDKNKAFLFLSSIPFRGFTLPINKEASSADERKELGEKVFGSEIIEAIFTSRSSFIEVPYLWLLYIGSLIWRAEQDSEPIKFKRDAGNNVIYNLLPFSYGESKVGGKIGRFKYFNKISNFDNSNQRILNLNNPLRNFAGANTQNIDLFYDLNSDDNLSHYDVNDILKLPFFIRDKLKSKFEEWVISSSNIGWQSIKNELEIFNENNFDTNDLIDYWKDLVNESNDSIDFSSLQIVDENVKNDEGTYNIRNIDNYLLVGTDLKFFEKNENSSLLTKYKNKTKDFIVNNSYSSNSDFEQDIQSIKGIDGSVFNFFLEMGDDNRANEIINNLLKEKRIIGSPAEVWEIDKANIGNSTIDRAPITAEERENKETYFKYFRIAIDNLSSSDKGLSEEQELKEELFNSIDNEDIKLSVYKNIKNLHDKWIAGSNNSINICGAEVAQTGDTSELFERFKFLDRSFSDMSDKMIINPTTMVNYLTNNFNSSYYNLLSRVLSDNNVDFIPLPTYIDFTDPEEFKKVFEPFTFSDDEAFNENQGPTFVCMYIGERSNSLDLGNDSQFENTGFDFEIGSDGDVITNPPAEDFTSEEIGSNEDKVPVFMVNYADQNQSIFKDFTLDQSEFTETNESLIVQNQISKRGAPSNQNPQGQNLYSVYQKRAYHCEIEALGTAFIQPLMYFQLNNVPMFHGAYTIINVSHSIQPNHMTTRFTGVRVGRVKTPFVKDETVYMDLVGSLSDIDLEDDINLSQATLTGQIDISDYQTIEADVDESLLGKVENDNLSRGMKALLDTIAFSEGTLRDTGNDGYDILVGFKQIQEYNKTQYNLGHNNWYNPEFDSTAAGRYQFLGSSWSEESVKAFNNGQLTFNDQGENDNSISLSDADTNNKFGNAKFRANIQDLLAANRVDWRLRLRDGDVYEGFQIPKFDESYHPDNITDDLTKEKFAKLIARLAPEWASFPNLEGESVFDQESKDIGRLFDVFKKALDAYS